MLFNDVDGGSYGTNGRDAATTCAAAGRNTASLGGHCGGGDLNGVVLQRR